MGSYAYISSSSATCTSGNAASTEDCFACLAVLLEDGQAEGTAVELARGGTKMTRFKGGVIPTACRIGQEADQDFTLGHPGWAKVSDIL